MIMNSNLILANPLCMTSCVISYLMTCSILRKYMQTRNTYVLSVPMQVYNFAQIVLNVYMIYGLVPLMQNNIFGINASYSTRIEHFVYVHYLSKYLDFFDTFFMILRKKSNQLSFLHIYHHSTIGLIWGSLLFVGHGNGTAAFGALLNSIVHTIMYSHYLCTSMGYHNPFKKVVTQVQMVQFCTCIVHSLSVMAYEKVYPRHIAWLQFMYHIQMIFLFGNFYKKNY